jgi:hypothetical protein
MRIWRLLHVDDELIFEVPGDEAVAILPEVKTYARSWRPRSHARRQTTETRRIDLMLA